MIGDEFTSYKKMSDHFDGILAVRESGKAFHNADVEHILTYHPRYEKKDLVYLTNLVVVHSKEARLKKTRLYVILFNNTNGDIVMDDYVSLSLCIRNALKPVNESKIREYHTCIAFYNAIIGYPIGFSMIVYDMCIMCKQMKHAKVYSESIKFAPLLTQFLREFDIPLMDVNVIKLKSGIILADKTLTEIWNEYYIEHNERVEYICFRCYHDIELLKYEDREIASLEKENDEDEEEVEDNMIMSPHITTESPKTMTTTTSTNNRVIMLQ